MDIFHNLLNIQSTDELEGNPLKGNSWEGYVIVPESDEYQLSEDITVSGLNGFLKRIT